MRSRAPCSCTKMPTSSAFAAGAQGPTPANETAFRYAFEDGVGVFYWIDDSCGYALSGNIDKGQLLSIARVVYGQLAAQEVTPSKR